MQIYLQLFSNFFCQYQKEPLCKVRLLFVLIFTYANIRTLFDITNIFASLFFRNLCF